VATLACAFKENFTFAHKAEQLYAYLSTAGEDTRLFGFDASLPPPPLTSLLTFAKGTFVSHGRRGTGMICQVDPWDPVAKPYMVQYSDGEQHRYSIAQVKSKLRLLTPSALKIEGTGIIHPTHGPGVIRIFDPADPRDKPYVVEFSGGVRHHYSLAQIINKFRAEGVPIPPAPLSPEPTAAEADSDPFRLESLRSDGVPMQHLDLRSDGVPMQQLDLRSASGGPVPQRVGMHDLAQQLVEPRPRDSCADQRSGQLVLASEYAADTEIEITPVSTAQRLGRWDNWAPAPAPAQRLTD
jgi:hypothetical protein